MGLDPDGVVAPVGFLGALSTDPFGDLLMQTMLAEGIDASLVRRSSQSSPLILVAPDADEHPHYAFHARGTADSDFTVNDLPEKLSETIGAPALLSTVA